MLCQPICLLAFCNLEAKYLSLDSYQALLTSFKIMKIGPIPLEDGVGKEVITRMTANMATEKVFFTDSNGRDFLKRVTLTIISLQCQNLSIYP